MAFQTSLLNIEKININVPTDYASLDVALKFLSNKYIYPSTSVTINVAAGSYNFTNQISFNYRFGNNVSILGDSSVTAKTVSSFSSVSGSTGNWSCTYILSDVSGITTSCYIMLETLVGDSNKFIHQGCWKVTAINTTTKAVTVLNTYQGSSLPSSSITGGTATVQTTVFNFTNCNGLLIEKTYVLGMINNIAFVGNNNRSYNGITTSCGGYLNCGTGIGVSGFGNGILSINGGFMDVNSVCASNNTIGFYSSSASYMNSQYSTANGNLTYGFCSSSGSFLNCDYSTAKGNVMADYYASDMSLIRFYQRGNNNSPVINPSINTTGNNNSIIAG